MVVGRFIGWILIVMALGFAIAEISALGLSKQYGIMSAYSVLHTLVPGELILTRIIIGKTLHPVIWDPFIKSLLWLPGWLLLGLPGIICIWKFRDLASETTSDDEAVDSSYEDILAAAEEFDKIVENEEFAPSTYGKMDEFDPALLDPKEDFGDEELLKKSISDLKK
jgi:hypothetical protein